jgi:hypothetical protein
MFGLETFVNKFEALVGGVNETLNDSSKLHDYVVNNWILFKII